MYCCEKCNAKFSYLIELDCHLRMHRKQREDEKENEDEKAMVGGVIKYIKITGSRLFIELENGFFLDYDPSDGGYSYWETGFINDKR